MNDLTLYLPSNFRSIALETMHMPIKLKVGHFAYVNYLKLPYCINLNYEVGFIVNTWIFIIFVNSKRLNKIIKYFILLGGR